MDADTDDKVFAMNRPQSIRERIGSKPPASPLAPAEAMQAPQAQLGDDEALPLPGDAYQARSRAANKPQAMLCLIGKPPGLTCLAYADLRWIELLPPEKAGSGPVLLLKFHGVADVRIEGRHVNELVEPLRRHSLHWLREQLPSRGFQATGDDGAVVITGMGITPAKR